MKRIVICADGTWNRPEKNIKKDVPTNVLRLARAIKPSDSQGVDQQVFYDWGVGSYYDKIIGGATGRGLHKNIKDDYRYIVQNYSPGDELYFFGFSRGAYTVRSLCGLINNCGILQRPDARLIQAAFNHYKRPGKKYKPRGSESDKFREKYSHRNSQQIRFVGVWDTVGALGIPFSFLGFMENKDEFYDSKMGPNIAIARHALAIDEQRVDFEPTIWRERSGFDLAQVWFVGVHTDIGGGYPPDKNPIGSLSDIPFKWMMKEAAIAGLTIENYLSQTLNPDPNATRHQSRKNFYRSKPKFHRKIGHGQGEILIHDSVKQRWDHDSGYRPRELKRYIKSHGWQTIVS